MREELRLAWIWQLIINRFTSSCDATNINERQITITKQIKMTTTALNFKPIQKDYRNFFEINETPVRFEDLTDKKFFRYYPDKKIIINGNLNEAISIVNTNFFTVKHQDAFQLGVTIFELMFGVTPQIHKETLNDRTTDYSVDLISEKCKIVFDSQGYRFIGSSEVETNRSSISEMNPLVRPNRNLDFIAKNFYDEYYPFVRVSNYLREGNSFYIELGYYRYRCSNGMMLGRKTKMTFRHSYRISSFERVKEAAIDNFLRYKMSFMNMAEKLWRLLSIHIPKAQIRLVSFDIFEKELIKKSIAERIKLQLALNNIVDKYVEEIGENLNAALNVATEFSKLLEGKRVSQSTMQNLSTIWTNRVTKKTFNLESYLNEIHNIEEEILNAKEVKEEEEEIEY